LMKIPQEAENSLFAGENPNDVLSAIPTSPF
jgi:hypothetical protein